MGVLNVTPDSFSDGGRFSDPDQAIAVGLTMWDDGADIVDVGGESTRPGSDGVDAATEIDRVLPVVSALAAGGVAVSIDTSKPEVAAAALDAGAVVVNDVTAFSDVAMAQVAASSGCGVVLMHMLGEPRTMQQEPTYGDVVQEVRDHLVGRAADVIAAGVDPFHIALDPGIGFGKTVDHNLRLLSEGVRTLAATGHPVLVGASRKSFLGAITGEAEAAERAPETIAAHALAIAAGASIIRTHDVAFGVRSSLVATAIVRGVVEQ
ncbi:MAG: dihydropteroate synthase [Acidimicrobiia bacterium]